MKMNDRFLSMLGLATKAGKLSSGSYQVEESIKRGKAQFVVIAKSAGKNTSKKFQDMCNFYQVPSVLYATAEDISHACGKHHAVVVSVNDEHFKNALMNIYASTNGGEVYGKNKDI